MKKPLLDGKWLVLLSALFVVACSPTEHSVLTSSPEPETSNTIVDDSPVASSDATNSRTLETRIEALTLSTLSVDATAVESDSLTITLDDPLVDMASEAGTLYAATANGVYRVLGDEASLMPYIPEDGAPDSLGTVLGLFQRDGGLLIESTEGLFEVYEWAVVYSPLNEITATVSAIATDGSAEALALFVGTQDDTYYLTENGVERLLVDGEGIQATALTNTDEGGLLATQDQLFDMNLTAMEAGVGSSELFGTIASMASADGLSAIASSAGPILRQSDGSYIHLSTADGAAAHWAGVDGQGRAIFSLEKQLIRTNGETVETLHSWDGDGPMGIGTDLFDNVWFGEGDTLTRLHVGTPVSFEESIADLFGTQCNGCHVEGYPGPKHDFTNYDEVLAMQDTVLERVSLGLMPPGGLSSEDLETVILWYQSGVNP